MSGGAGFGARVDAWEVSGAVDSTRVLRLALNVLWDGLPGPVVRGVVLDGLEAVHRHLSDVEAASLRESGVAEYYMIVRPVSLVSPPPAESAQRIAEAVRTLASFGMLVGQDDAGTREE